MGDIANQDEARKCLEIASANLQSGHLDKASRFAEKAMKLYPNDEARKIIRLIKSRQGGPSSSGASPSTNGSASAADMRRRTTAASSSGRQDKPEDRSTPQQKELVASILRKKSYYEVLGVEKDSNEDEIKRAYKKLALKLHPDKNTAPRSDEAFKIVSKAFSCLSDAQKRAAYDRYGEEEPGLSRTASRGPFAGQGYDDFDPNEIFNMFFGGGFAGQRNAHVFNFGRGFPGQHQQRAQGQAAEPPSLPHQLLSILPILLMLAFTFFAMRPSEPVFSIDRGGEFLKEMKTARYNVPYFVKASTDFERTYPRGSRDRARVEQEAEVAYKERLDRQCYNERMQQQRMFRWGQPGKANSMPMPSCKEIVDRFGNQYAYQSSMYGF